MKIKDHIKKAIKASDIPITDKKQLNIFLEFSKKYFDTIYEYSYAFNNINSFLSENSELTITIHGESYFDTKKVWCTLYLNKDFDPTLIPLINRTIIHYYNKKITEHKIEILSHIKRECLEMDLGIKTDKILYIFQKLDVDSIER